GCRMRKMPAVPGGHAHEDTGMAHTEKNDRGLASDGPCFHRARIERWASRTQPTLRMLCDLRFLTVKKVAPSMDRQNTVDRHRADADPVAIFSGLASLMN